MYSIHHKPAAILIPLIGLLLLTTGCALKTTKFEAKKANAALNENCEATPMEGRKWKHIAAQGLKFKECTRRLNCQNDADVGRPMRKECKKGKEK